MVFRAIGYSIGVPSLPFMIGRLAAEGGAHALAVHVTGTCRYQAWLKLLRTGLIWDPFSSRTAELHGRIKFSPKIPSSVEILAMPSS